MMLVAALTAQLGQSWRYVGRRAMAAPVRPIGYGCR